MRSCASGVARPKKGTKVRNVEGSKKKPQPESARARMQSGKKKRRDVPRRTRRSVSLPARQNSWSYHFSDAYQRRPFCQFFFRTLLDRSGAMQARGQLYTAGRKLFPSSLLEDHSGYIPSSLRASSRKTRRRRYTSHGLGALALLRGK